MNIDFNKITAKAEQRRLALVELDQMLITVGDHVHAVERALSYVQDLMQLYGDLDQEGREYLPKNLKLALDHIYGTSTHLGQALDCGGNLGLRVIEKESRD